jgi:hypothetical protein
VAGSVSHGDTQDGAAVRHFGCDVADLAARGGIDESVAIHGRFDSHIVASANDVDPSDVGALQTISHGIGRVETTIGGNEWPVTARRAGDIRGGRIRYHRPRDSRTGRLRIGSIEHLKDEHLATTLDDQRIHAE